MGHNKSLDEVEIIAALFQDVETSYGIVFNSRARRLTILKVKERVRLEGLSFLTKTLPRLGKAFDKALQESSKMNRSLHGFKTMRGSELPIFMGELFKLVFRQDGSILPSPCAEVVTTIRDILYCFYKYKLPYNDKQEQQVIQKFKTTEDELLQSDADIQKVSDSLVHCSSSRRNRAYPSSKLRTAREARILISRLFSSFDPTDIKPRHGPGIVSTRERLSGKYQWSNVSDRITSVYPLDAYFFASLGHVCDRLDSFNRIKQRESSAKVILVPKDSRGPRLISCESVDYQWIQQGLGRAIVQLVESHPLTKENVRFTDQVPNRLGALEGSKDGRYSTLDLNEASDRVSLELVRLLFPPHVFTYLEACRSLSTELPDGSILPLRKFAPMGSSLCFPILAIVVWSILTAAASDSDASSIYVYGDDVIVPTAFAADAIEQLESFGLKVNRDKSCTTGLFRESCGMDAFQGVCVTPVRIRTVWSSLPSPDVYTSWIAYANSFYRRRYFNTYDYIVRELVRIYGFIPGEDMHLACPSLIETPEHVAPKSRTNHGLQRLQYRVWDVKAPSVSQFIDGWSMLLRFFAESGSQKPPAYAFEAFGYGLPERYIYIADAGSLSVGEYTSRRTSLLVRRWR